MRWHEGYKKWFGYTSIIAVLYLACRFLPLESATLFASYAFKAFVAFVIGDVTAEHLIGKWLNGKNGRN
jgi:hypothetical protein